MKRETTGLMIITLILLMIGVLMVYSTSAVRTPPGRLFISHLLYVAVGLVYLFIFAHFDYHSLASPRLYHVIAGGCIILLLLVLMPGIGVKTFGAQRWVNLFGFRFQPSEFAKVALVVLLAAKLTENQEKIKTFWRGFVPPLLITGVFAGLIVAEKDLGMPVVLMAMAFVMVFVAGTRWIYILSSGALATVVVVLLAVTSPHRIERLRVYFQPWEYRDDEAFQLVQSLTAFARGGIFGRGPGASEQKLYYLPAAHTDFIFAVWAEEMGLVGCLAVVLLYALLLLLALRVAACARDTFGSLLATGIITLISVQAAFIMAVTTGLLPTKGLPLPFISSGGTAIIVFLMLMGILLNISRQAIDPDDLRIPKVR